MLNMYYCTEVDVEMYCCTEVFLYLRGREGREVLRVQRRILLLFYQQELKEQYAHILNTETSSKLKYFKLCQREIECSASSAEFNIKRTNS